MRKVAIVTDSTVNMPKDLLGQYTITILPQVLIWGDQTYEDGIDIHPSEFYQKLATAKVIPTTSQISALNMQKAFQGLLEQGYDVLGIFLSEKLSGTMLSATQGREMLEKDQHLVELVDSRTTAMAMGFQILTAARAAAQGASLAECKALVEQARAHTGVYFVVDTLEFLHRGGRIGGAQRLLGTALNLKPLLSIQGGIVEPIERIRTKSKAVERLIEIIVEQTAGKSPVRVSTLHANVAAEAEEINNQIARLTNAVEANLTDISPVIGVHTGPGAVGIAYMAGM